MGGASPGSAGSTPTRSLTLYFDTSALVKLLAVEEGSDVAAELWSDAEPVAASVLAFASALELGEGNAVLVTWDTDLQRAAERAGLVVAGV